MSVTPLPTCKTFLFSMHATMAGTAATAATILPYSLKIAVAIVARFSVEHFLLCSWSSFFPGSYRAR